MEEYIERLKRLGYSSSDAYTIMYDFFKNYSEMELEDYIRQMESDVYVGRVQS